MLHPLLNGLIFETQSHGLMYSFIVFKYVNLILRKEKYNIFWENLLIFRGFWEKLIYFRDLKSKVKILSES